MTHRNYKTDKRTIKAGQLGFSARSIFKLQELNNKYHFIHPKQRILDLGASPGSFIQYYRKVVKDGFIIGCDLKEIPEFNRGVQDPFSITFTCDLLSSKDEFEQGLNIIFEKYLTRESQEFDLVTSDAMANTSGIAFLDHESSIDLAMRALEIARTYLRPHGNFICKFFSGQNQNQLVNRARSIFNTVKVEKPDASKRSKKEFFLVCLDKV